MRRNKQTDGERIVKDIKRKTRKQYSAEEKLAILCTSERASEHIDKSFAHAMCEI